MRKNTIFILIFLLVFFLQLNLVYSLGTGQPRFYDTSSGTSQIGLEEEIPPQEIPETVPSEVSRTFLETQTTSQQIMSQFIIFIFQFFGIVILFVMLIILLQSFIESK